MSRLYRPARQRIWYDVTADPDWPLLREARELKMVSAVPLLASSPGVAGQFAVRLRSIADAKPQARWTPYSTQNSEPIRTNAPGSSLITHQLLGATT